MEDGTIRLADFGLVKPLKPNDPDQNHRPKTSTGVGLGTPEYMPPEQRGSHKQTFAADVYPLGIILLELITGQRPIHEHSASPGSTLQNCSQLKNLPNALRDYVLKLTDRDPKARYENAKEAGEAFERVVDVVTLALSPTAFTITTSA